MDDARNCFDNGYRVGRACGNTCVLEEIEVDYRDNIRAVIEKKYRNIQDEKIRRRAVAALQRLGYGWEDIKAAINDFESGD